MTLLKQYKVRSGVRFGFRNQFSAGDTILLTENEASGFLDKLELYEHVEEPDAVPEDDENAEPDVVLEDVEVEKTLADKYVETYSVKKILGFVASGTLTAEDVLEAERAGKKRKSLISKLEERLG